MRKIKALLVDDETEALEGLTAYIREFCPQVEICATALSVQDALKLCMKHSPDLVFLDVLMPGGNGFELLEALEEKARPEIIFTTAYEQYAIRALREGASDYLLKPVDIDELQRAVKKAEERLISRGPTFSAPAGRLRVLTLNGVEFIPQNEVLFIEADGRYSVVNLVHGKTIMAARNIGDFDADLAYKGFFRVHKSFLVNCAHINAVREVTGPVVILSGGRTIEIARRKKAEFMTYLDIFRNGRE
jgi:two-component system, LytTR family, response regulator